MQVDLGLAADFVTIAAELTCRISGLRTRTDDKLKAAANDNGLQWPFIAFPKDWYSSP
jgi:hypothetical protein